MPFLLETLPDGDNTRIRRLSRHDGKHLDNRLKPILIDRAFHRTNIMWVAEGMEGIRNVSPVSLLMEQNALCRQSFELRRIDLTFRRLSHVEFWIYKNILNVCMSSSFIGESDSNIKNVVSIEPGVV